MIFEYAALNKRSVRVYIIPVRIYDKKSDNLPDECPSATGGNSNIDGVDAITVTRLLTMAS